MLSRYVMSQVKHNSYFLVGLTLGLWVALALVPLEDATDACVSETLTASVPGSDSDEYEPHREERPLGSAGQPGRSVQRPRYYSTELGMRAGLLAGALSSEDALETRGAALNNTARLQPALRFFITASSLKATPGRANVVGFTDTREMLKPFHALKYLADNYLEEYDFFFLVSDSSYVNARRLNELVSKISVSQDVYMGSVADDDTHYCTLEGGILLSNSVLRAVHGALDWCVRNSYSPHHHENIGRCVLHAAHLPCTTHVQDETYLSVRAVEGAEQRLSLREELADAVTAFPLTSPEQFYLVHSYVSRVYLERIQQQIAALRRSAALNVRHHPRGYRNTTWPSALRTDPSLAPPRPASRFDHLRWTRFNSSHVLMPDDHRAVAPLNGATREAIQMIVEESGAWAKRHWGASDATLVEGAWCWEPPYALRYSLLLRLEREQDQVGGEWSQSHIVRQVEAARPLGAARLAPARYVTESTRLTLVLPLRNGEPYEEFLRRYESVCLERDGNTALLVVPEEERMDAEAVRASLRGLAQRHSGAQATVAEVAAAGGRGVLHEAVRHMGGAGDALLLLVQPDAEFSQDFLDRVRMNTIRGEQWYSPVGFARYAAAGGAGSAGGAGETRAHHDTGRFLNTQTDILAVYRDDYIAASEAWRGAESAPPSAVLVASKLRVVRAPEPALLRAARGQSAVSGGVGERDAAGLNLGARHSLARLVLHAQSLADVGH